MILEGLLKFKTEIENNRLDNIDYMDNIATNIEGLAIYKNKIFSDSRGTLMQLAPNVDENPNFPQGIKNLISGIAIDKNKPRGGHYHNIAEDEVWNVYGTGLWYFLDLRDGSRTKGQFYACVLGLENDVGDSFKDLAKFFTKDDGFMAQLHIPAGVYHIVWPLGENPFIYVETKAPKFSEDDCVRINPDEIAEVADFRKKYNLA